MAFKKLIFPAFAVLILVILARPCAAQESIKDDILKEVNNVRVSGCMCGDQKMPPVDKLTWSDQLEKAAARHTKDMYDHDHLSHIGTDGSDLGDRISGTGYKWSMVGENISWGFTEVADVVNGWIGSPEHCKNMMSPAFKEMGAAKKDIYWVLDLGVSK
jgi:uncharacterized protein YkwD